MKKEEFDIISKGYVDYAVRYLRDNPTLFSHRGFKNFESFIKDEKNFRRFLAGNDRLDRALHKVLLHAFNYKTIPQEKTLVAITRIFKLPISFQEFQDKVLSNDMDYLDYTWDLRTDSPLNSRLVKYFKIFDPSIDSFISLAQKMRIFNQSDLALLKDSVCKKNPELCDEIKWELINEKIGKKKINIRGLKLHDEIFCFYILYPLNSTGKSLLELGELKSSSDFREDHIEQYENAVAIYISWVYGYQRVPRAFILLMLQAELSFVRLSFPNITTIYTRPATSEGQDVVKNHKFNLYNETNGIYSLPLVTT